MAVSIKKWVGTNGDILLPLSIEEYNDGDLYSVKTGALYMAQFESSGSSGPGGVGSPMGLLFALTYAA